MTVKSILINMEDDITKLVAFLDILQSIGESGSCASEESIRVFAIECFLCADSINTKWHEALEVLGKQQTA